MPDVNQVVCDILKPNMYVWCYVRDKSNACKFNESSWEEAKWDGQSLAFSGCKAVYLFGGQGPAFDYTIKKTAPSLFDSFEYTVEHFGVTAAVLLLVGMMTGSE